MTTQLLSTPPPEQRQAFLSLTSPRDVAKLLDYHYSALVYQLYKVPDNKKYESFEVQKKSGGIRVITSPSPVLKLIQRRLSEILQNTYKPKPVVYGFVTGKNIVGNARRHKKKNWVLNVDLENFFPSINFGRVRGMFIGKPYNLPDSVATVLAQICCFKNVLPQGAPTSPIVSNMICAKMDSELQDLAWNCRCFFTRYADDITLSTTLSEFPVQIAKVHSLLDVEIGKEFERIIVSNGFNINPNKTRAFSYKQRQEVTGLTVNKFPNVRRKYIMQVRAMLYAWETHGIQAAEAVHNQLYGSKHRNPISDLPSFQKVVKGKIEFLGLVKGKDNTTYQRFRKHYHKLILQEKGLRRVKSFDEANIDRRPRIYTEGITDAMILQTAWKKLYLGVDSPFIIKDCTPIRSTTYKGYAGGADVLKNLLKNLNEDSQLISIGIFDRDDAGISAINEINYAFEQEDDWKISLQRKAGCFALPIPMGREKYAENKNLCIEFYFDDQVIASKNPDDRGLSLSLYLGKKEISTEDDPEMSRRYPELRKIKDDGGKMIFAKEIVPSLRVSAFEPFKLLFDKVLKLIERLENVQT